MAIPTAALPRTAQGITALVTLLLILAGLPGGGTAASDRATGGPDATIVGVSFLSNGTAKVSPDLGDVVEFNLTLWNLGDANATGITVNGTYANATAGPYALPGAPVAGNLTPANGSNPQIRAYLSWNTSGLNLTPFVNYTIVLSVMAPGDVNASNDNATRIIVFDPPPAPHLYPSAIAAVPDNATQGDRLLITGTFRNDGDLPSAAGPVRVTLDGSQLAAGTAPGLQPGDIDSWTLDAPWDTVAAAVGNHTACAVVDVSAEAACVVIPVRAPPPPPPVADLVISRFVARPPTQEVGAPVELAINVTNLGDGASNATWLEVIDAGALLVNLSVPQLAPNATATIGPWSWDTAGGYVGNHSLRATVDPERLVPESNDLNNSAPLIVLLTSKPDIAVVAVQVIPHIGTTPLAGAEVGSLLRVEALVRNVGLVPSPTNVSVAFRIDPTTPLGIGTLPSIGAGSGNVSARVPWNTTEAAPGLYRLCATVDPGLVVQELNESNNDGCGTFTLTLPPPLGNLRVAALRAEPAAVFLGDPVNLTASVAAENLTADRGTKVRFTVRPLGTTATSRIADQGVTLGPGGAAKDVTAVWLDTALWTGGSYTLCAVIDPQQELAEDSETDNEACAAVTLAEPPELRPDPVIRSLEILDGERLLRVGASTVTAGTKLTVRVTLLNRGPIDAHNVVIRVLADGTLVGNGTLVAVIRAGQTAGVNVTWRPAEGRYDVDVEARIGSAISAQQRAPFEVVVDPAPAAGPLANPVVLAAIGGLIVAIIAVLLLRASRRSDFIDYEKKPLKPTGEDDREDGDDGEEQDEEEEE